MLRLGNIDYSNCYPIHGPVLERYRPAWLQVVDGPPSDLNRRLATGELDIAPGSSIELARHHGEYSALRGLCIGSAGPVESIVLVSRLPLEALDGRTVALPTASASSRCLLRILLELRLGLQPCWVDFDQTAGDPLGSVQDSSAGTPGREQTGPVAALFIGDIALRRPTAGGELRFDLGREWTDWTDLPFVYAVWMVRNALADAEETRHLHRLLTARRDELPAAFGELADAAATRYGFSRTRLLRYWSRIRYELDETMLRGLEHFLGLASDIGEIPPIHDLTFVP